MKKRAISILVAITSVFLVSCGSASITETTTMSTNAETSATETEVADVLNDVDFIVNLGKGLEARWAIIYAEPDSLSDNETLSEYKERCRNYVNVELDCIGDIDDYKFENEEMSEIARNYYDCLELQKNAVDDFTDGTDSPEWNYATYKRYVLLEEFYSKYGLTVSDEYEATLQDMIDTEYPEAKKYVAIQDFVNNMTVDFQEDTEKALGDYKYYKALVTNDTEYEISSVEIDIDLLDEAGVVVEQKTCWLSDLQPDGKYYAEFSTGTSFSDKNIRISANY